MRRQTGQVREDGNAEAGCRGKGNRGGVKAKARDRKGEEEAGRGGARESGKH